MNPETETYINSFIPRLRRLRADIKMTCDAVLFERSNAMQIPADLDVDRNEAIANLVLAYRHLEDAAMRLGKCIQACDGGESIYDRAASLSPRATLADSVVNAAAKCCTTEAMARHLAPTPSDKPPFFSSPGVVHPDYVR